MPPQQANEKICALCGQSCAGQPRVRDEKGRYAHQACAAKRKSAPPRPDPTPARDDDNLMNALLDDLPVAVAEPPGGGLRTGCPGCGVALAPDAVVCVRCGFDARSGKALRTAVAPTHEPKPAAPPKERSVLAAGTSYLVGACLGAGLAAVLGAGIWAGLISAAQIQLKFTAVIVGALCGIGAAYGARGNVSAVTGAIAVVFAVAAIIGGKWYGGSAVIDKMMDDALTEFQAEWDAFDDEQRWWYAQEDRAVEIMQKRIRDGATDAVEDMTYAAAFRSENYPDSYPKPIVAQVEEWWYAMDEDEQERYIAELPGRRIAEFEAARAEMHEAGFMATFGVRDALWFAMAIILAFGLGSNENTAPFVN